MSFKCKRNCSKIGSTATAINKQPEFINPQQPINRNRHYQFTSSREGLRKETEEGLPLLHPSQIFPVPERQSHTAPQEMGTSKTGEREPDDPQEVAGLGSIFPCFLGRACLLHWLLIRKPCQLQDHMVTSTCPDCFCIWTCAVWHAVALSWDEVSIFSPKNQLRSGISPSQRKQSILSTMEEPPAHTVPKSSFSSCPLVPNVSLRNSEYQHSANSTSLYNTRFCPCISKQPTIGTQKIFRPHRIRPVGLGKARYLEVELSYICKSRCRMCRTQTCCKFRESKFTYKEKRCYFSLQGCWTSCKPEWKKTDTPCLETWMREYTAKPNTLSPVCMCGDILYTQCGRMQVRMQSA